MSKNLTLFWGFTKKETSYNQLLELAPKNLNCHTLSFEELIPKATLKTLETNVLDYLSNNNIQKTCLLGTSLGGALAIIFTNLHPERVEKLILVDCEGVYDRKHIAHAAWNFFLSHNSGQEKKFSRNFKATLRTLSKPLLHLKLGWLAHHIDVRDYAQNIGVPTTIIWAELDHITPLWQGQRLHQLIKHSKLVILKKLDHDWILYYPQKFWQLAKL